jgi:hypothetical protein
MPISRTTFYLICLIFLSFLIFFIKKIRLRQILRGELLFREMILGQLTVFKHAADNLAKVKNRVIDIARLESNIKEGYTVDGYEAVIYQNKIVVYDKPTLLSYVKRIFGGMFKKWLIIIENEDVIAWYVDKQKRHLGLKALVNKGKKDLLIFIFFPEDKAKQALTASLGHKYSTEPFEDPLARASD